ncbi:hypothetical protein Tco_1257289, partial [Tanacetum coccineum]
LATRSGLIHRGVYLVSELCPFCDSVLEELDHWVFKCALWAVWKWRNRVVTAHPDMVATIKEEDIFPFIQRITKTWISARFSLKPINWSCWISRPFDIFM